MQDIRGLGKHGDSEKKSGQAVPCGFFEMVKKEEQSGKIDEKIKKVGGNPPDVNKSDAGKQVDDGQGETFFLRMVLAEQQKSHEQDKKYHQAIGQENAVGTEKSEKRRHCQGVNERLGIIKPAIMTLF